MEPSPLSAITAEPLAVLDALPACVVLLDAEGAIVWSNRAWQHLARGHGFDDHASQPYMTAVRDLLPLDDEQVATLARGVRSILLRQVGQFSVEYHCEAGGKPARWDVCAAGFAVDDQFGAIVLQRDALAAIAPRDAGAASFEDRFAALADQVPGVVYAVSLSGASFRPIAGSGIEALLGYSTFELAAQPDLWERRLHPDDRERVLAVRERVQLGAGGEQEYRLIARDGRVVWVHDRVDVLRDAFGQPALAQGLILDITARKQVAEQRTRDLHLAFYDALTGLPNRSLFTDRLAHALHIAGREQGAVGVLHLGIDRFKAINDSLGRTGGDALLRGVAQRAVASMREADTVGYFGGDEFLVLLERTDEGGVVEAAVRLTHDLAEPLAIDGREMFVTASVGIALGIPGRDDAEIVLHNAATALHAAKQHGAGRVEVYDPTMRARALDRMQLEGELRRAIERRELCLHYQPKIDLRSGRVVAFEALVRWQHPERGLVSPASFIPLAEESGLILPLGQWVISEACRQAREWRQACGPDSCTAVNVNLSARQFLNDELAADLDAALREAGIGAECLGLEITESVVMDDADTTMEMLRELKQLGFVLAIDDFGTGYSSLSYLKRFPVDLLKIDRSFIAGLHQRENRAIVSAMIQLAHALEMRVVGEGIETATQAGALRAMGCDIGQGYYFSPPVPNDQALDLAAVTFPLASA